MLSRYRLCCKVNLTLKHKVNTLLKNPPPLVSWNYRRNPIPRGFKCPVPRHIRPVAAGGAGGRGAGLDPHFSAKECPWPRVHFNFRGIFLQAARKCKYKLNVLLRIWIAIGHKTCTLWHEVYLRYPSTCTAAAAIAVSVVNCVCGYPGLLTCITYVYMYSQSSKQPPPTDIPEVVM